MSHVASQEDALVPVSTRRVNFSDDHRELHLQAFFNWLPKEFHATPHVNWTRLPSRVIGYLVRTVAGSPFAVPLALAAFAGCDSLNEVVLKHHLIGAHLLLRSIQTRCGVQNIAELTNDAWIAYVATTQFTPKDYAYFKRYAILTETHLPDYLEKL